MLKKLGCLVLTAALFIPCAAMAVETDDTVTYAAVYSADNPIPEIAARLRPSVVQVFSSYETWDAVTRISGVEDIGYGSGCYIMTDEENGGYVLTNYHVVEEGDVYRIEWLDGTAMDATLVGYDDGTDIAIMHFDEAAPEHAEPIPLGDSDALAIGELAICIGYPGAGTEVLPGTVTAGIISGVEREDINANNFSRSISVIQTDAAINTGSSGGALLNAKGELVGIPTLKFMYSNTSVYEGLGFCIPINSIRDFIDQIITTGGVVRPRLGLTVSDIDGPDEPMHRYPPIGVQVYTVEEGGPAAKAGVQIGDVITEIDGVRITSYNDLLKELDKHESGDTVTLKTYRYYDEAGELTGDYEEFTFHITLKDIK